ncbi:MAG: sensor domain-containing diguanylate cyclase [Acidimicrobiia bacterium]|nr:sensor domain-containing diguanylate cyclase [Acidimicrobiia bacterium]
MTSIDTSFQEILDNMADGLYFTDRNRIITYWNHGAERISGFDAQEVVGRSCAESILTHVDMDGNYLCDSMCPLYATILDGEPREAEVYLHHKDGHRVPVAVRVTQLKDSAGEVIGGVELFTDLSSQEANLLRVKELERLALLDQLTQLANRAFLERELEQRLTDFNEKRVPFGLLFMDIDFFKKFNDTYGHDVGDDVLRFVSKTLTTNARPFDVYGRWGGEEFLGVIRNVEPSDLREIGERMRANIGASYVQSGDERLSVTISVGATVIRPGDTIDDVVKRADTLLYESKENGRDRVTLG